MQELPFPDRMNEPMSFRESWRLPSSSGHRQRAPRRRQHRLTGRHAEQKGPRSVWPTRLLFIQVAVAVTQFVSALLALFRQ